MTQEEKAKAYDEVIDKVAHFIKKHVGLGCMVHPNSSEAKELFNIFPELKESEDLEEAANKVMPDGMFTLKSSITPEDDEDAWSYEQVIDMFKAGANWQKERIIDKACKWIAEEAYKYFWWDVDEFFVDYDTKEFLKDFRKAMEDEK